MNTGPAEPLAEQPPDESWGLTRWIFLIAFVFAAHFAFVFLFGSRKVPVPRAVTNVPQFQLADNSSELIALTDPTLFALPHLDDFAPADWLRPPAITQPSFRWTEPPSFLPPAPESLGMAFVAFVQTNSLATFPLDFKPAPQLTAPEAVIESALPQNSTLKFLGALAQRPLQNPIVVPTLAWNDVIAPSRVQLLVDAEGKVVSTVLLQSSEYDVADQKALALARAARFVPATGLMFGELLFNWHTVPTNPP